MKTVKIHSIDNGFCRINYISKSETNVPIYYCIQQNSRTSVELLRCSQDGEPSHPVSFSKDLRIEFEVPTGESELETLVRIFIETKQFQRNES